MRSLVRVSLVVIILGCLVALAGCGGSQPSQAPPDSAPPSAGTNGSAAGSAPLGGNSAGTNGSAAGTCEDVTSYDYNWDNDMKCTRSDGSIFYTDYAGAERFEMYGDE